MEIILQVVALIECVPNVSEGLRREIVTALGDTIATTPGIRLLDYSADPSHNRAVYTFAGDAKSVHQAVIRLFARAIPAIDLRSHRGEHPRIGAIDVVPLIPLGDTPMKVCVALARTIGRDVAGRFDVPIYLYEEAASSPERRPLENIRRGGFERLAAKMCTPGWHPDFGPLVPHPTAGAAAIGARQALIAFNVNLDSARIDVAREIAASVRARSGGLPAVKALGIELRDRGIVQVSINLTDYRRTSLRQAFDAVSSEAARRGAGIRGSEIVGLVPAAAIDRDVAEHIQLRNFREEQILERALERGPTF